MRVLFDTNIFISYLLAGSRESIISTIVEAAFNDVFTLIIIDELLQELTHKVITKEYLQRRITGHELERLIAILKVVAETIPTITDAIPAVTRDPKDDYLLVHALVGKADYLVTGDHDLLILDQVAGLTILSPQRFASMLARDA